MITRRRIAGFSSLLLILIASCLPLFADSRSRARDDYALLFGTVYGADEKPLYGVKIKIRRVDQKKAKWEVTSDHRGEFAQRVPAASADYIVWTDVDLRKHLKTLGREEEAARLQPHAGKREARASDASGRSGREARVHVDNDERVDVGLHLTE